MNITIDGNPLEEAQVSGNNLEDILQNLNSKHVPMNRTVVEVRVNEETYQEAKSNDASSVLRGDIQNLELLTKSPREVGIHFMENASAIVANIAGVLPQINELLRIGDPAEANDYFVNFLNSFQLLVKVLPQVNSLFPGFLYQETEDHPSLAAQLESANTILSTLLDTQGSSDWTALADALESDLTPALHQMGDTLGALEAWVQHRAEE